MQAPALSHAYYTTRWRGCRREHEDTCSWLRSRPRRPLCTAVRRSITVPSLATPFATSDAASARSRAPCCWTGVSRLLSTCPGPDITATHSARPVSVALCGFVYVKKQKRVPYSLRFVETVGPGARTGTQRLASTHAAIRRVWRQHICWFAVWQGRGVCQLGDAAGILRRACVVRAALLDLSLSCLGRVCVRCYGTVCAEGKDCLSRFDFEEGGAAVFELRLHVMQGVVDVLRRGENPGSCLELSESSSGGVRILACGGSPPLTLQAHAVCRPLCHGQQRQRWARHPSVASKAF